MRNLVITLFGFLAGTGVIVALVLAAPRTTAATATQSSPRAAVTAAETMSASMTGGSMMAAATPQAVKLTIVHVQRGCHIWSSGQATAAMMRLHLKVGQQLFVVDQDVDAHQMMELAGPAHLRLGGPMMMNRAMTIAFAKKGVYHLGTKTVEMPGGGMEVKTVGPDNKLRLVVTVA